MLIDIFITIQVAAIVLLVMSLIFKDISFEATILLLVMSTLFFFVAGVAAFNIEHSIAIVNGNSITSTTSNYHSPAIAWLNIGLGFISLVFTFYNIFWNRSEE